MAKKQKTLAQQVETHTDSALETSGNTLQEKVEKIQTKPKNYVVDLRIHSPASLGYLGIEGIDTAPALVRLAKVKGLDVIAVTDYYSGDFIDRMSEASRTSTLTVIPGVTLRCKVDVCDDLTLLALFPEDFGTQGVNSFLRTLGIPAGVAGNKNYIVERPFEEILEAIERYNGRPLPSRMDKTPSRQAVIPLLVEKYGFRAFDLAYADSVQYFKKNWPKIKFQLFSFSNANALAQVGSRIAKIKMTDPGFIGLREIIARAGQAL
ncbi:MAG: hypothetical protein KDD42_01125 [Bdellovibrionales bacterium]|nr:hypothetical protein [Bdellovibrionales bacterium]